MKKIILIICLAVIGNTQAQASSIVIRPVGYVVAPPSRTIVVSPPCKTGAACHYCATSGRRATPGSTQKRGCR